MSEVYTYQELRELALKHGIRDNKVHIGVWLQTQGYQKQRIQINHIRKIFYLNPMIETRIPIAPDTSTTLTDETTEHIIHRKVTIKIDRDYLRKKYPELFERLAKIKLPPSYKRK